MWLGAFIKVNMCDGNYMKVFLMKSLSKVILFCLIVSPVFVNAGEKQKRQRRQPRRESACTRAGRILGAPIAFLGSVTFGSLAAFSFYRAYQAQAQMPFIVCSMESSSVTLYSISDACDEKIVFPLMENGVLRNDGQCYLYVQNWKYPLFGPKETLHGLAKTGRKQALEKGDHSLAKACLLYDKNNN